jgi:hypothetical protein
VRARVKDKRVLALVKAFLKAGVLTETGENRDTLTGTPQGGILSPLIFNIAMTALDEHLMAPWEEGGAMSTEYRRAARRRKGLPNYRLIRYAADFAVLTDGTRQDAEALRGEITGVLATLGLRLSEAKTRVMHLSEGLPFLGFRLQWRRKRGTSKWYVYTFIDDRPVRSLKAKIRALTPRTSQLDLEHVLTRLNQVMHGWANYFRHAVAKRVFAMLDQEATQVSFDSLDFDSVFASRAADDWLTEMRATGSVFLSGGTMQSATVLRPIVEGLVGSGRIMDAMSRPMTHVQELSETFTLRDDRFDTSDFALITDDYSVTGAGSVGIDGSVDLKTRIQLTSLGVQKMFMLGSLDLPTSALPNLPPIPAQVTGSLENLIVRPNVSALPRSTVEWLVDALLQSPRTIGGAVVHTIGRLWGGARRLVGAGD